MSAAGELLIEQPSQDTLQVILSGRWKLEESLPSADVVQQRVEGTPGVRNVVFDTRQLADWDSGLLIFLINLREFCTQQKLPIDDSGLPQGARKLLALAAAVPEKKDARKAAGRVSFLAHLGNQSVTSFNPRARC